MKETALYHADKDKKSQFGGDKSDSHCINKGDLELFDIRTPDGKVTGKVKERSEVHHDGDLHGTSHVWIVRDNDKGSFDVLLQKRSANKDAYPGCYDISSAGHIPAGSDFLESAIRELKEELGIVANKEELIFIGMISRYIETEFYGKPFNDNEISAVYIYQNEININELKLQKEEVESVVWMDYNTCIERMKNKTLKHCIFWNEFQMLKTFKE